MFAILPLSTAPNIAPIVIIDPNTNYCKSGHTKEHWNLSKKLLIIFRVLLIVFLEVIYLQGAAWHNFLPLDAHQYPQLSLLTINGWRGLIIIFSSDTLWLNMYFTISISTPHPTKPINSTTLRHLCWHLDFFISILSFVPYSKS